MNLVWNFHHLLDLRFAKRTSRLGRILDAVEARCTIAIMTTWDNCVVNKNVIFQTEKAYSIPTFWNSTCSCLWAHCCPDWRKLIQIDRLQLHFISSHILSLHQLLWDNSLSPMTGSLFFLIRSNFIPSSYLWVMSTCITLHHVLFNLLDQSLIIKILMCFSTTVLTPAIIKHN